MSQRASRDKPSPTHLLFASALETWCHHLLYVRRVYPSQTFCDSYFLGVRCKANRHPGVVDYISNAVEVAVPALIGRVADEFSLEVIDDGAISSDTEEDKESLSTTKKNAQTVNQLLLSSNSTPPSSQEPRSKRRRSSQESEELRHKKLGLQPSALFSNESTHRSLSSLSSAPAKGSQDTSSSNPPDDTKSTPTITYQDDDRGQTLEYKSLHVMEKFSLYFSPCEENQEGHKTTSRRDIPDLEDLGQRHQAPLFTKQRASSRPSKAYQEAQNQEEALVAELERGFRNLILNLSSLNRDRVLPSPSLTFKLVLHVNQREKVCPAIENALDAASWYPCSAVASVRRPQMPLYQVVVSDWDVGFHMQQKVIKGEGTGTGTSG